MLIMAFKLLVTVYIVFLAFTSSSSKDCISTKVDLVVVVDSIRNVFDEYKNMIMDLTHGMSFGPKQTQLTLVLFNNSRPFVKHNFDQPQTDETINKTLSQLSFDESESHLSSSGLEMGIQELIKGRWDAIKIIVVMTDGNSNDTWIEMVKAAEKLHKSVAQVYVVSLGNHTKETNLKRLVGNGSLVTSENLDSFKKELARITSHCKDQQPLSGMDPQIVVTKTANPSAAVTSVQCPTAPVVRPVVLSLKCPPPTPCPQSSAPVVRPVVLSFKCPPPAPCPLKCPPPLLCSNSVEEAKILASEGLCPCSGQKNFIVQQQSNPGLPNAVSAHAANTSSSKAPTKSKAVPASTTAGSILSTTSSAKSSHSTTVSLIAAIPSSTSATTTHSTLATIQATITSGPPSARPPLSNQFTTIENNHTTVQRQITSGHSTTNLPVKLFSGITPLLKQSCPAANIMFVIDTSGNQESVFNEQIATILDIIESLEIDSNLHQVALLLHGGLNKQMVQFSFTAFNTAEKLKSAVKALPFFPGSSSTGATLKLAGNLLADRRTNVLTAILLFTDGLSIDDAVGPAETLRFTSLIAIYAIGISNPVSRPALVRIAGSDNRVFTGTDVKNLKHRLYGEFLNCTTVLSSTPQPNNSLLQSVPITTRSITTVNSSEFHRNFVQSSTKFVRNDITGVTKSALLKPIPVRFPVVIENKPLVETTLPVNSKTTFVPLTVSTSGLLVTIRPTNGLQVTNLSTSGLQVTNRSTSGLQATGQPINGLVTSQPAGGPQVTSQSKSDNLSLSTLALVQTVSQTSNIASSFTTIKSAVDTLVTPEDASGILFNDLDESDDTSLSTTTDQIDAARGNIANRLRFPVIIRNSPFKGTPPQINSNTNLASLILPTSTLQVTSPVSSLAAIQNQSSSISTSNPSTVSNGLSTLVTSTVALSTAFNNITVNAQTDTSTIEFTSSSSIAKSNTTASTLFSTPLADLITIKPISLEFLSTTTNFGPAVNQTPLKLLTSSATISQIPSSTVTIGSLPELPVVAPNIARQAVELLSSLDIVDPNPANGAVVKSAETEKRPVAEEQLKTKIVSNIVITNCFFDLMFIVDASGSVGNVFKKELKMSAEIVDRLIVGPNHARVSMITFAGPGKTKVIFSFDKFNTTEDIKSSILATGFTSGTTFTNEALDTATDEYNARKGDRAHRAPFICILFTDGYDHVDTAKSSQNLRNSGATIFAVAFDKDEPVNRNELVSITGDSSNVFTDETMKKFHDLLGKIEKSCKYGTSVSLLV